MYSVPHSWEDSHFSSSDDEEEENVSKLELSAIIGSKPTPIVKFPYNVGISMYTCMYRINENEQE